MTSSRVKRSDAAGLLDAAVSTLALAALVIGVLGFVIEDGESWYLRIISVALLISAVLLLFISARQREGARPVAREPARGPVAMVMRSSRGRRLGALVLFIAGLLLSAPLSYPFFGAAAVLFVADLLIDIPRRSE